MWGRVGVGLSITAHISIRWEQQPLRQAVRKVATKTGSRSESKKIQSLEEFEGIKKNSNNVKVPFDWKHFYF